MLVASAPDLDPNSLRQLALGVRDRLGPPAVVIAGSAVAGKGSLVGVVTKDLVDAGVSAGAIISEAATELGGGGSHDPELAQAGRGPMATVSMTPWSTPGTAPNVSSGVCDRSLGVDYGTKRVGLATSDSLGITARPLSVVPRSAAVDEVVNLVKEHDVGTIVVGLPTGLSGDEGMSASEARKLADELGATTGPKSSWSTSGTPPEWPTMLSSNRA